MTERRQEYHSDTAAAAAVAKQLRLGRESVRRWVVQAAEVDAGGRGGVSSEEHAEIKALKAKVRRLEAFIGCASSSPRQPATCRTAAGPCIGAHGGPAGCRPRWPSTSESRRG